MSIAEKDHKYRFEFKHLFVVFAILIAFQIVLSLIHTVSLRSFLAGTRDWYQKDSAEKLATVTSTSLELLVETVNLRDQLDSAQVNRAVQSVNIILSQQLLGRNAKEVCIIVARGGNVIAIDDGATLVSVLADRNARIAPLGDRHASALRLFAGVRGRLRGREEVISIVEGKQTFHTFVPFVPNGEFVGAVYVKNEPDFRVITSSIVSNYNETSIIFTSLIVLGLLAMFFVSSYTVRERDRAQRRFFEEHEELLREKIAHEKESVFTKRIYHAHHKAEKVMAFIKQDLSALTPVNTGEIRYRISKYANFISRVIYDMKWYDPPLQAIRNAAFVTDINEVIRFLVDNLFLRVARTSSRYAFELDLDPSVPSVHVNEFVVWELLEPVIQNSLVHAGVDKVMVTLRTRYAKEEHRTRIMILDNGGGIQPDLLEWTEKGMQRMFLENVSTKQEMGEHSGYGCFIAYDLAKNRCGWDIEAENLPGGGCCTTITIIHQPDGDRTA